MCLQLKATSLLYLLPLLPEAAKVGIVLLNSLLGPAFAVGAQVVVPLQAICCEMFHRSCLAEPSIIHAITMNPISAKGCQQACASEGCIETALEHCQTPTYSTLELLKPPLEGPGI